MDKIKINDLSIRAIIGTEDYEREAEQEVIVNVTLFTDITEAGTTDDLQDTIDYSELKNAIYEMAVEAEFQLIESLAEEIAAMSLDRDGVVRTKVSVQKPSALRFTRSAEVEIVRES